MPCVRSPVFSCFGHLFANEFGDDLFDISIWPGWGNWPSHDPDGRRFDGDYFPKWAERAGSPLAGGFRDVIEGLQGDQSWLHETFEFSRAMAQSRN